MVGVLVLGCGYCCYMSIVCEGKPSGLCPLEVCRCAGLRFRRCSVFWPEDVVSAKALSGRRHLPGGPLVFFALLGRCAGV